MIRRTPLLLNIAFSSGGGGGGVSGLHEWLLRPASVSGGGRTKDYVTSDRFRMICEKAGVSNIGFLRHGNTSPAPKGGVDFDRLLTDTGREQARMAGISFGKESKPFFDTVLVSPAPRTIETAKIFIKAAYDNDDNDDAAAAASSSSALSSSSSSSSSSLLDSNSIVLKPVQRLYDGTMQPKGSALFRKIGYAPLKNYLDCIDNNDDRIVARTLLGEYAYAFLDNVLDVMKQQQQPPDPNDGVSKQQQHHEGKTTLWFVGHAIYLPAAALGIASLVGCDDEGKDTILSANTLEAEGYLVDVSNAKVKYLERPKEETSQHLAVNENWQKLE